MAERSVAVRLRAEVAGAIANVKRFERQVRDTGKEIEASALKQREAWDKAGVAFTAVGGAIVAGLGLATNAAINFESAFAGVRKTVDASEPELARLAQGLRDLSTSIPTSVGELAGIAESAGQLGIATDNVLGFTATMADLAETTNLTSEEAATSLARLANITQMSQDEFDRLGSTIVALGNNFATTEAEIVEMGTRIAGAGAQIGLTEPQIMAVATALSSLGINAEAGGTAISKVMIDIASQVENSGDKLGMFAEVAGMSAEDFARAWRQDASAALGEFVLGLGDMEGSGRSTLQVLEELEITEVRMRDALLRASGAGELWARTGETANRAWEDNVALTQEAAQRYETVEARVQMARNALNDAAITIGNTFAPAVGGAADAAAGLAGSIADLPGPAAAAVGLVGGLGGAASLAAGGFLLAAPRIVETRKALQTLAGTMPRTVGALRGVGTFLTGPWGIAIAGAVAAVGLFGSKQAEARRHIDEVTATLDDQTGALTDNSEAWVAKRLSEEDAFDLSRRVGVSFGDVQAAAMGQADAYQRVVEHVNELRDSNDRLYREGFRLLEVIESVSGAVHASQGEWRDQAIAVAEAEDRFLDVQHAIDSGLDPSMARLAVANQDAANAQDEAAGAAGGLEGALDGVGDEAQEAVTIMDALNDAIATFIGLPVNAARAAIGFESALDDMVETLKDGELTFDRTTEAGRENEQAVLDAVEAAGALAQAKADEGESIMGLMDLLQGQRESLEETMRSAGMAEDEIQEMLDTYGFIPDQILTNVLVNSTEAQERLEEIGRLTRNISRSIAIDVGVRGGLLEGRAAGGPVRAGTPYIVGERRPELFVPSVDGTILPSTSRDLIPFSGGVDPSMQQLRADLRQIMAADRIVFAEGAIQVVSENAETTAREAFWQARRAVVELS